MIDKIACMEQQLRVERERNDDLSDRLWIAENIIEFIKVGSKCSECDHVQQIAKLQKVVNAARAMVAAQNGGELNFYNNYGDALERCSKALAELDAPHEE